MLSKKAASSRSFWSISLYSNDEIGRCSISPATSPMRDRVRFDPLKNSLSDGSSLLLQSQINRYGTSKCLPGSIRAWVR